MARFLFPLLLGLVGLAVLVSLGFWQVQRLTWKSGVVAEIDARLGGDPVVFPLDADPAEWRYLPVAVEGGFTGERLYVLGSTQSAGAGYRVIEVLARDDGGRLLVDRGFVALTDKESVASGPARLVGNLHWPDETDGWTPDPEGELWFARDVPAMAEALGTAEIMIVAREVTPPDPVVTPVPVDSASIPNDHLEYAITWFALAAIWAGMTAVWIVRIRSAGAKEAT